MSGRCLLDTNIIIVLFADEAVVKEKLAHVSEALPENDLWIAAIASQCDLVLITRDRHFNEIEGLILEVW
jgi:tRNA(fMet)-specific endonuclease VapC